MNRVGRRVLAVAGALLAISCVLLGSCLRQSSRGGGPRFATTVRSESSDGSAELARYDFERIHFGNIPVRLTVWCASRSEAERVGDLAHARIDELEAMMSDYAFEPPSPLNRIAAEAPCAVAVPGELFTVLEDGVAMHRLTGGAFDITAKPFVQLWRVTRRVGELPPADRLDRAGRLVDIEALELDARAGTARLTRSGMWLDVGGLAKGHIGDLIVALLRAEGVPRCRYHAGGDMVFGDPPPGESGWTVEVPDLRQDGDNFGAPQPLSFQIANAAASVSGDVYRFVEIEGTRYSHVIDPRTGLGVTARRVVCVRGPRGAVADALATAGQVMAEGAWRAALRKMDCRGDRQTGPLGR